VETDCGLDEDDSCPSPVTVSATTGSDPDKEVVQEEATLLESGQMAAARTNQRGSEAAGGCGSVEEDGGGRDEEDLKLFLVTSSALLTDSYPVQEDVQGEALTTPEM
jgi:hypothetical protein